MEIAGRRPNGQLSSPEGEQAPIRKSGGVIHCLRHRAAVTVMLTGGVAEAEAMLGHYKG